LNAEPNGIKTLVKKKLFGAFKHRYYQKYKRYFCIAYETSDLVVLLSAKYLRRMDSILRTSDRSRLISIPNPTSFSVDHAGLSTRNKKNQVLFVGRLEYASKRLDRLIRAWGLIEHQVPDWQLVIVGGDSNLPTEAYQREEQDRLERLVLELKLKNVHFAGQQMPVPYYQESKIFCLTSSYEGFPMVLGEAMQHGVVPIVFESFESASDIIQDGVNGVLVPPFNIDLYATELKALMCDEVRWAAMSEAAQSAAAGFTIDIIGEKWINIFKSLTHKTAVKDARMMTAT
jgi:glycosyltransferase involved in cell wall biosynthesis